MRNREKVQFTKDVSRVRLGGFGRDLENSATQILERYEGSFQHATATAAPAQSNVGVRIDLATHLRLTALPDAAQYLTALTLWAWHFDGNNWARVPDMDQVPDCTNMGAVAARPLRVPPLPVVGQGRILFTSSAATTLSGASAAVCTLVIEALQVR